MIAHDGNDGNRDGNDGLTEIETAVFNEIKIPLNYLRSA